MAHLIDVSGKRLWLFNNMTKLMLESLDAVGVMLPNISLDYREVFALREVYRDANFSTRWHIQQACNAAEVLNSLRPGSGVTLSEPCSSGN